MYPSKKFDANKILELSKTHTPREISQIMGCSYPLVHYHLHRHKVNSTPPKETESMGSPEEAQQKLYRRLSLLAEGKTLQQIADIEGLHLKNIKSYFNRHLINKFNDSVKLESITPEDKLELLLSYGITSKDAAKILNVSDKKVTELKRENALSENPVPDNSINFPIDVPTFIRFFELSIIQGRPLPELIHLALNKFLDS